MGGVKTGAGVALAATGLLGALFFWATDPRLGVLGKIGGENPIDAANAALPGTIVGVIGSLIVLATGVWLLSRK